MLEDAIPCSSIDSRLCEKQGAKDSSDACRIKNVTIRASHEL